MCLKYNHEFTQQLKSESRPLTLYKVYKIEKIIFINNNLQEVGLVSLYRASNQGGSIGRDKLDHTVDKPAWWVRTDGEDDKPFEYGSPNADKILIGTSGFHCFLDRKTADEFASIYSGLTEGRKYKGVVVELTSHSDSIIAAGDTPGFTVFCHVDNFHNSFTTVVVDTIKIAPEEFDKVIKDYNG